NPAYRKTSTEPESGAENAPPGPAKKPKTPILPALSKPVPVEHAPEHPLRTASKGARKGGDVETVDLTRATYKLPLAKAHALAAFLSANLSDEIEVREKAEAIQVTASREDQAVIAQLIRLLQTRGSTAARPDAPREIEKNGADALPGLPRP